MSRFAVAFVMSIPLALAAAGAHATSAQGTAVMTKWKSADKCTQQAQTAFPDHTAEANAKRDAALKACLDASGLPPREPLSPGH
ncbi:MAG: hypothetical protein JO058_21330 [Alphaproteobacteria bacterium]|nr:hypothetical protein [Alphaproteobacteria bacterium]MBV9151768.1 hypothetical protein [Alphaproteobacteria bacterium]MBV9968040.1 hypothetical protein [Alphaproteobacteria bacterium]